VVFRGKDPEEDHIDKPMKKMADLLRQGQFANEIIEKPDVL